MNPIADDILKHYGMPKRSGRYPWGSGDNPYQRSGDFLSRIEELKKQGLKETEIARAMGFVDPVTGKTQTTKLRTQQSLAKDDRREMEVQTAKGLRDKGYSLAAIAEKMGYSNDSSVRSLLNQNSEARMKEARNTADFLREQVDKKGKILLGAGVEREMNVSSEKLKQALYILEMEGYPTYGGRVPQVTNPGKMTTIQVLCPPGTPHKDIYNFSELSSVKDYISHDGGETFDPKWVYPKSLDSKRLQIRYAEEGGKDKDGVVELRRGVPDLDLGGSHYSQVRILVDDNKYIKGMAVYSDDMPDGIDIVFNTNKKQGTPKLDVLKNITDNPDNPFGSLLKQGVYDPDNPDSDKRSGQSYYRDKDGNKQLSLINKRSDEGDWDEWGRKVPAQFLSKQSKALIDKQLTLTIADRLQEFEDIQSLTNPTIKRKLLKSFSDDCDAAAVHLKAVAFPKQRYQVILPITSMSDTEVYAPNYKDGEKVALIRFPHGGTFEIPILTVNTKQPEAIRILGKTPADVVGINSKVAERLSGADFDGDTVMVIPHGGKINISSSRPLKGLEGFDAKMEYPERPGMTYMKRTVDLPNGKKKVIDNTQIEMGKISNLITDMTLKGAPPDELARAVRHSMVVIDAGKHKLDYKLSEDKNGIKALKKSYQGSYDADGNYSSGAATLISRAKSKVQVEKTKGSPIIDKETGKISYKKANETYFDPKTGKMKTRMQDSTLMAETDDAFTLVSDANNLKERAYAEYANKMKALANQARKEMVTTGRLQYNPSAKIVYQEQFDSLTAQNNIALKNAPRERQAQVIAASIVAAKQQENEDITRGELKKIRHLALTQARQQVGAKRQLVTVSEKEWEAIQAGAITDSQLSKIIDNADIDRIRQLATPRATNTLTPTKINKIEAMKASGYTTEQIAESIGVSTSTISKYILGK